MQRPVIDAVDGLETLLRVLPEIRSVGPLLPAVAVAIVVYLGLQPEHSAKMGELQRLLKISQQRTSQLCGSLARKGLVRLTHAVASVISIGIAALSFFTVAALLVITRMAARSGTMTRPALRRRLKVICAFSALTGLSGSLASSSRLTCLELRTAQFGAILTLATACKRIWYDAGAMSRMPDRLESKGLNSRRRTLVDRRLTYVELKEEGWAAFLRIRAVSRAC